MNSERAFSGLNVFYDSDNEDYSDHSIMVQNGTTDYFVTVFSTVLSSGDRGLSLKTVASNGLTPTDHYVTDDTIGSQKDGYLVVEPGSKLGYFYVVWTESASGNWRTKIRKFQVSDIGFTPVTESVQLCGENGDYVAPRLTLLSDGSSGQVQLLATWVSVAEAQIEMLGLTSSFDSGLVLESNSYTQIFTPQNPLLDSYWSSGLNLAENHTEATNTVVDIALSSNGSDIAYMAVKSDPAQIDLYAITMPGSGTISSNFIESVSHQSIDHFDMVCDTDNNQLAIVYVDHSSLSVIGMTVPIFGKVKTSAPRATEQLNTYTFQCVKPRIIVGGSRLVVTWETKDSCGYVGTYTHEFGAYGAERAINDGVTTTDLLSCAVTPGLSPKILTVCCATHIGDTPLTLHGILYDTKSLS
ncbi:TPA: hypothetical protein ACGTRQ_003810 [Vibrio parahaemolyticus]